MRTSVVDVSVVSVGSNGVWLTREWGIRTEIDGFLDLPLAILYISLKLWGHDGARGCSHVHGCGVGVWGCFGGVVVK